MAKYIDAEAVKSAVRDAVNNGFASTLYDLEEIIDALPAAEDVEPVKSGRWVPIQHYDSHDLFECSECGRRVDYAHCDYTVEDDYPYCHCGAKMDEEI